MANNSSKLLPDLDLELLNVALEDKVSLKLLMLIEGTFGIGVKKSIEKYGYTEQRYYQILKAFQRDGSDALVDKKRGPKENSKRDEKIIQQIIRYRFSDPRASAAVIAQKLNQTGNLVSQRRCGKNYSGIWSAKRTISIKSKRRT